MENLLAKALYDNKAESSDELAFRKGDILTVIEQNVLGSEGWWKCSLHGRQGLAPANRLHLLSPFQEDVLPLRGSHGSYTEKFPSFPALEKPPTYSVQNIYQIPTPARPVGPAYEVMESVYKVPLQHSPRHPVPSSLRQSLESTSEALTKALPFSGGTAGSCLSYPGKTQKEVYDVPTLQRRSSQFTMQSAPPGIRKHSQFVSQTELEKPPHQWYDIPGMTKACIGNEGNVYAVPPAICQDPSYDIPVPSSEEGQKRLTVGYNTLPNPRKSDWIYDVPVSPEKQELKSSGLGSYGTLPSKGGISGRQLFYDTLPARTGEKPTPLNTSSVYDIPKSTIDTNVENKCVTRTNNTDLYDVPPSVKQQVFPVLSMYDVPQSSGEHSPRRSSNNPAPLQSHMTSTTFPIMHREVPCPMYDRPRGSTGREGQIMGGGPVDISAPKESVIENCEQEENSSVKSADSQRNSTASTSSSSSCDSLPPTSLSPEPQREVTLTIEEAIMKLGQLQSDVCQPVSRLMVFISSQWRARHHLAVHLEEVRSATEEITASMAHFLDFARDVRGNAKHLKDISLQARLQKQLAIVEDSGLILQEAAEALAKLGWHIDSLFQDDTNTAGTPDHLDRFVMVARTVPEDVKRLVSILNANSKLLFRQNPKVIEVKHRGKSDPEEIKTNMDQTQEFMDSGVEDNDYVQLQRKEEFEEQQKAQKHKAPLKTPLATRPQQAEEKAVSSTKGKECGTQVQLVSSEHCRLYFGALQKAIGVFVTSLIDGQPPEKFISHSKLVIMVGQKLVDCLCKEAHKSELGRDLLSKSNHLCALLKQLAVATKKAAVHFPDKIALQEAQDFAKELAQRAQNFRTSLQL
ncbi:cas scaffolding protein family member 4 [Erpetoichthys calabaricus]|uniref:Cas scaffold protein family member 4 n=1 Tax=Erpetoichthys calabaricus TaxID=27687 RepID=A0A8C4S7T7_ERPCA|nr:cas scaffolding protein family member 4 [Erpetoichthys calabaricus]